VQLITICAVVKSKCAVETGNVCTKKCRDSGQNYDLCADHQLLCNCKSCLEYVLLAMGHPFMTSTRRGRGSGSGGRIWTGEGRGQANVDVHTEIENRVH